MSVNFPCLNVKLVPSDQVVANDYNPNHVAVPEYELLVHSIAEDGLTQPIVVFYDAAVDRYIVIDGFHRYRVLVEHFECTEIPVVVIEKEIRERMASTIRHNRARGKHQVDLMASLVRSLAQKGWDDAAIAEHLGMTEEELLRLRQMVGAARMLAGERYSMAYGREDEPECRAST